MANRKWKVFLSFLQLKRVYETMKEFDRISIDKIRQVKLINNFIFIIILFVKLCLSTFDREDRGKVGVKFTVKFKKDTKYPLKPLYEQIARDHLGTMPVYRDTLVRGGTILLYFMYICVHAHVYTCILYSYVSNKDSLSTRVLV